MNIIRLKSIQFTQVMDIFYRCIEFRGLMWNQKTAKWFFCCTVCLGLIEWIVVEISFNFGNCFPIWDFRVTCMELLMVNEINRNCNGIFKGFADSAGAFLNRNKQQSFAFELHEAGFDVFLMNARGNIFSQRHSKMNSTDPKFWQFSWHELGVYDLPATIDYILNHTNQTKLAFVGVSQGCAALLVMLSELPEYNEKISIAHLMAPAVIFKYLKTPIPRSMELIDTVGVSEHFYHKTREWIE